MKNDYESKLITCNVCGRPIPARLMIETPLHGGHVCPFCAEQSNDFEYKFALEDAQMKNRYILAQYDQHLRLAAGITVNIENGKFGGDPKQVFEYVWKFQAEDKFKSNIAAIASIAEELSYEKLCNILVLRRPSMDEIMPLVEYMSKNYPRTEN